MAKRERKLVEPTSGVELTENVEVAKIDVGTQLVRRDPDDDSIIELAADIGRRGLLQPICVSPRAGGRYELIFGLRRLLAHKRLGRVVVPAFVREVAPDMVKAVAVVENIQRQQMSLEEECSAVAHLHEKEGLSPDQIGTILSKSRAWVLARLSVPGLPEELRTPLLEGRLAQGSAAAIALVDDESSRRFLLQQTLSGALTVSQVRAMVEAYQQTPDIAEAVQAGVDAARGAVAHQPVMMACAACGLARKLEELVVVRICAVNCPAQEAATKAPEDAH